MHNIQIEPMSLNHAYRGRRFKTKHLSNYQRAMRVLLPKIEVPEGKLQITYLFGVSSKRSDADNLSKVTTDCIAEQYGFNDNRIYRFILEKVDVKRGEEFIQFKIESYI